MTVSLFTQGVQFQQNFGATHFIENFTAADKGEVPADDNAKAHVEENFLNCTNGKIISRKNSNFNVRFANLYRIAGQYEAGVGYQYVLAVNKKYSAQRGQSVIRVGGWNTKGEYTANTK